MPKRDTVNNRLNRCILRSRRIIAAGLNLHSVSYHLTIIGEQPVMFEISNITLIMGLITAALSKLGLSHDKHLSNYVEMFFFLFINSASHWVVSGFWCLSTGGT